MAYISFFLSIIIVQNSKHVDKIKGLHPESITYASFDLELSSWK